MKFTLVWSVYVTQNSTITLDFIGGPNKKKLLHQRLWCNVSFNISQNKYSWTHIYSPHRIFLEVKQIDFICVVSFFTRGIIRKEGIIIIHDIAPTLESSKVKLCVCQYHLILGHYCAYNTCIHLHFWFQPTLRLNFYLLYTHYWVYFREKNTITFCFEIDEYNTITNTITTVTFRFEKKLNTIHTITNTIITAIQGWWLNKTELNKVIMLLWNFTCDHIAI